MTNSFYSISDSTNFNFIDNSSFEFDIEKKNNIYPNELQSDSINNISIIKIQSYWRGIYLRKQFKKQDDKYKIEKVSERLTYYNNYLKYIEDFNKQLSKKKIRNENFPSDISENIAKFAIYNKYGIMPCWDTNKGDLIINKKGVFKQIEVKGFMSDGPTSFGPTEDWDWIYFVDGKNTLNCIFKVYEIKLSNKSEIFRNIILSGTEFTNIDIPSLPDNLIDLNVAELKKLCENRGLKKNGNKKLLINRLNTENPGSKFKKPNKFGEIADNNRRGQLRGSFDTVFKPQLGKYCRIIFEGHISKLNNTY